MIRPLTDHYGVAPRRGLPWATYVVLGLAVVVLDAVAPYFDGWWSQAQQRTPFQWANIVEGVLWLSLGAVIFVKYRSGRAAFVAMTLACFGASDWVEAGTGAWWRPLWLLAWTAWCVVVLLAAVGVHILRRRVSH